MDPGPVSEAIEINQTQGGLAVSRAVWAVGLEGGGMKQLSYHIISRSTK